MVAAAATMLAAVVAAAAAMLAAVVAGDQAVPSMNVGMRDPAREPTRLVVVDHPVPKTRVQVLSRGSCPFLRPWVMSALMSGARRATLITRGGRHEGWRTDAR